jgi:hypothetical protein
MTRRRHRRGHSLRRRYGRSTSKEGFRKVWFSRGSEKTAGLVVSAAKLHAMSVSEISRMFPMSEAMKMAKIHMSPVLPTWDAAFHYKT